MKQWYCIYTKPKHEDMVCRRLAELPEIELFNPKLKMKKLVRSKLTDVVEELFPSYVFSKFNAYRHFHMIRYTRGVKRFVGDSEDNPYVIEESIVEDIKSRMKDGFVHFTAPELTAGDEVVISKGPFDGLSGIFLATLKPRERILILLTTLQYQARIEVEMDHVARANHHTDTWGHGLLGQ